MATKPAWPPSSALIGQGAGWVKRVQDELARL